MSFFVRFRMQRISHDENWISSQHWCMKPLGAYETSGTCMSSSIRIPTPKNMIRGVLTISRSAVRVEKSFPRLPYSLKLWQWIVVSNRKRLKCGYKPLASLENNHSHLKTGHEKERTKDYDLVGMVHHGTVTLGGDSASTNAWSQQNIRCDLKVFRRGEFLFGCTSSSRMTDLLRSSLEIPVSSEFAHPDALEEYMTTAFIDAVRACFKAGGYAKQKHERGKGGTFLVGVQGACFVSTVTIRSERP